MARTKEKPKPKTGICMECDSRRAVCGLDLGKRGGDREIIPLCKLCHEKVYNRLTRHDWEANRRVQRII